MSNISNPAVFVSLLLFVLSGEAIGQTPPPATESRIGKDTFMPPQVYRHL